MSGTASPTRCAPGAEPGPAALFAPAPDAGAARRRSTGSSAATPSAFALAVDLALLTLGGALKRQEMISARFGDMLSELYLSSAALKRWNDEGRQQDDLPLLGWCMEASFATIETRFDEIIANFPIRPVAWLLRFLIQPFGPRRRGPSDRRHRRLRRHHHQPVGGARPPHRRSLSSGSERRPDGVALLERAFAHGRRGRSRSATACTRARVRDIDQARRAAHASRPTRPHSCKAAAEAVAAAVAVDDFAPEELTSRGTANKGDVVISEQPTSTTGLPTEPYRPCRRHSGGVARRPVYIVDGSRTPFIKARGKPGPFTPVDLAVQCGRPLLLRQPFAPDAFDQVILGCVNVIADEMNPARVAALRLGMGEAMTAFTVQINCGSGMQSIDTAYRYIQEGTADLILAGGAESLSHAPLVFSRSAVDWYARLVRRARHLVASSWRSLGFRPSFFTPVIGLERGLTDPITDLNMGQTAELVAHLFHITRRQADEYAAESQQRLARAQQRMATSTARSSPPSRATARSSTTTTACGPTAPSTRSPSSSPRSSGRGAR